MDFQKFANQFRKGMFEPIEGCKFVISKNKKSGKAVVATQGGFSSNDFDAAINEVESLGLKGIEVVIACSSVTYVSAKIKYIRADLDREFVEEAFDAAKMHSMRNCKVS